MIKIKKLDLIALHGQTIYHEERVKSIQIGNPEPLFKQFNIPIIYNFRKADIEVGGTGAPLMPFLDWAILRKSGFNDITLNIGGISNITVVPRDGKRDSVIGFDTGPGMALIDECCLRFWNNPFDENGKFSENGIIIHKLLNELIDHPFIKMEFPKSTGRDVFGEKFVKKIVQRYLDENPNDILRTFVAFTAKSISENLKNVRNFSPLVNRLIVSGGGIHHPILMNDLKIYSGINEIYDSTILDVDPDYKEALLIAVLGYTKFNEISNNMPSVTGAENEIVLGDVFH